MKIPPAVSAAVHSELRGNITAICVSLSTFSGGISNSGTIIHEGGGIAVGVVMRKLFPIRAAIRLLFDQSPNQRPN